MERKGPWILTHKLVTFFPNDSLPEEILIEDIAHALSFSCRFGGHVKHFFSIGQHSVIVAEHCSPANRLMGLLHDASEAYLYDVASPLKQSPAFSDYRKIEKRLTRMIYEKFGVQWAEEAAKEVCLHDKRCLMTEVRDLLGPSPLPWTVTAQPYDEKIVPLSPEESEKLFLETFKKYKH